jgi:predicted O-methyltransferase YrrM
MGRQNLVYLEIGVFEGMSLTWMMQRVLTDESSRAVGIDPWLMTTKLSGEAMEKVMERAFHNLEPWSRTGAVGTDQKRCTLIRANSSEVLRKMNGRKGFVGISRGTVDICMIDGDHNNLLVQDDAHQVLPLLRPGGWMLFDDVENDIKKKDHVKDGLQGFLSEKAPELKFLWKHKYMEAYEKL